MQIHLLNFAAVVGFLQILVQFNHPLLVLVLLNASNLFQLTGPLVLQHLFNQDNVILKKTFYRFMINLNVFCKYKQI